MHKNKYEQQHIQVCTRMVQQIYKKTKQNIHKQTMHKEIDKTHTKHTQVQLFKSQHASIVECQTNGRANLNKTHFFQIGYNKMICEWLHMDIHRNK